MKIKIFVGIALVIFIFAVGSIIAVGLMQKDNIVIQTPDIIATVDTKNNIQQTISQVAANNTTTVKTTPIVQPVVSPQPVVQPQPIVQPQPVVIRRRVTRAS